MFSLAYSLPKTTSNFCPSKFRRKTHADKVDFYLIKITSKKVSRNTMDILTREITSKKNRWNSMDFSTSEITPKKVRGNDVDFSISEVTSKKYVEMMLKFVESWSSTYWRNIDVESMLTRRRFHVVCRCVVKWLSVLKPSN